MSDRQKFSHKDISNSEFRSVNMTGAIFEDVDLSGAKFFNINLRGADIGAVDFGVIGFYFIGQPGVYLCPLANC